MSRSIALAKARVTIVGIGGLGCPAALALAHAGLASLTLIDDDVVDRTNLHRQILFREADVGRHKLDAAADALRAVAPTLELELRRERLTPANALSLFEGADVVLECSDRYAVKFLAADAAHLARVPIVHGAAIRWMGTALAVGRAGAPCYRCLFEDLPSGEQASCDVAGVVGPVCGVIGAHQARLALQLLAGQAEGTLLRFDGQRDVLRIRPVARRPGCSLCGTQPTIDGIVATRYVEPSCS